VASAVAVCLLAAACSSSGHGGTLNDTGGTRPIGGATSTTVPTASTAADWPAYHHDAARTGVDTSSPAAGELDSAWNRDVDGQVYAEPLVVAGVVYVATEADTVYALDAATGAVRWKRNLGAPVDGSSLPCGNIDPSGITGTPVADRAAGVLWVVAFLAPAHHELFELSLRDGSIRAHTAADAPGADPKVEQERGALSMVHGTVVVPYGGLFGDCGEYHGWLLGFSSTTAARTLAYEVPNQREAGIWAPPGPVITSDGSILAATGNGTSTDAPHGSDSVLRLSATLSLVDSFTPTNWKQLDDGDVDLGTTSPVLLASDGLVLQVGKAGLGYLLRLDHLGGIGGELHSGTVCGSAFGGSAVIGSTVYLSCRDGLYRVKVTGGAHPTFSVSTTGSKGAGPPIVAGGVIWAVTDDGHLEGFDQISGRQRYRLFLDDLSTSFPTLAASAGRLFVPEGSAIQAFTGV
jgi:outer membrane protein assembly factor BamB